MKEIYGNLIEMAAEGRFDTIVHGCNCQGIMGAGIARKIAGQFPKAQVADWDAWEEGRIRPGSFSSAIVTLNLGKKLRVINAYTQVYPGRPGISGDAKHDRLHYIQKVFHEIAKLATPEEEIGIPLIGAGLAGGEWESIREVIEKEMVGKTLTVVRLPIN